MYCLPCRSRHRELSKVQLKRGKKKSEPKCDKTNNQACEVVLNWKDDDGNHEEPFQLHKNNFLAYELYERITALSTRDRYEFERNKKMYAGYFPSLSALEFILENYLPDETTQDDLDLIIDKISIIHNIRLNNFLN